MNLPVDQICQFLDKTKQSLLKGCQYIAILLTWFEERNKNVQKTSIYFGIYQKIFHSRRIFRLIKTINYIPIIIKAINQLKKQFHFQKFFNLLGNICLAIFHIFDNLTMILMLCNNSHYRVIRRISYTILLFGNVWETISIAIKLRKSFAVEADIKKQLEDLTPTQFLQKLNDIDQERKMIAYEFVHIVGDLFPTLARTNLPQIVIRTKINKGTVGFFGIIAALSQIIIFLKNKKFTM